MCREVRDMVEADFREQAVEVNAHEFKVKMKMRWKENSWTWKLGFSWSLPPGFPAMYVLAWKIMIRRSERSDEDGRFQTSV